jgi:hypothetical protein
MCGAKRALIPTEIFRIPQPIQHLPLKNAAKIQPEAEPYQTAPENGL